jgi:pimeloyl-ACP methyl ester carboxylesterase
MVKQVIQFSHANGFPALSYKTLFNLLSEFEFHYIDCIGHNPRFPVTDNWPYLVDELIEAIEQGGQYPVIGMGHSLGGAVSFLAAIKRPDLFKALILLDPPILSFFRARAIQWLKTWGVIDWITPAKRVERRRAQWDTPEQAREYFQARSLFSGFTSACLDDYLEAGLKRELSGQYSPCFQPSIEALIFNTLPHIYSRFKHQLKVPTTMLVGESSDVVHLLDLWSLQKNFNVKCKKVPGGHLFPFEKPETTAKAIRRCLAEL